MFTNKCRLKVLATCTALILLVGCTDIESVTTEVTSAHSPSLALEVYKNPSCGCCKKWINHLDENGFQSKVHNSNALSEIKDNHDIAPRYRSCHTAISTDGFVFEGHVPAKYIQQFLSEKHPDSVIGLAVPAMPLGSPGMEMGDKFQPYLVLLLHSDGSNQVYANVQSYEEQFND